uniref:NET domain-containing protein n=1 Tax=viral metagenome TaxID=1070528 RepID=A0A6C0C733_9ZZZZ
MNIEEKKIFIYKNINKIDHHNEIVDYIKTNDIKYTENSNGFFVNISLIDEHINNIYNILQYTIHNNIENDNMVIKKQEMIIDNNNNIIKNTLNNYNIELKNFNKKENKIIIESKKYKFDN